MWYHHRNPLQWQQWRRPTQLCVRLCGRIFRFKKPRTSTTPIKLSHLFPGASIPMRQWCISHCLRFPPVSEKNFRFREIFSKFYLFPNFFSFSSVQISHDFFNHQLQCWISPYFACFSTFPPYFAKIIISPLLLEISLCFPKIYVFFTYFMCNSFFVFTLLWPWCICRHQTKVYRRPSIHFGITQCMSWTPLCLSHHVDAYRPNVTIRPGSRPQ